MLTTHTLRNPRRTLGQATGVLALALLVVPSALAQSFNVDVGTTTVTGPGFGPPSAAFGGAAGQAGTWNEMNGTVVTMIPLLGLDGLPTAVTLTRTSAVGGNFGSNNANTTGDFQLLLDDGQDVGGLGQSETYTFAGLAPGVYDLYTYAIAPDSATFISGVTVPASPGPNPQNVGGPMPADSFVLGVTHALHSALVCTDGTLAVTIATVTSFATINGFQLVAAGPCPVCGDGAVGLGEDCDDGNLTAGDGCGPTCLFEECGNGFVDPGEDCDDANTAICDGCVNCLFEQPAVCGNGILECNEICDDGNADETDGCLSTCMLGGTVPPAPDGCVANFASFTSTDTPLAIPPTAPPNVNVSTITVAGVDPYLWDVNVTTSILHSFVGDLDITLTSPGGTSVTLTTDNGAGNNDCYNGTVWDDQADPGNVAPYLAANSMLATDTTYTNLVVEQFLTPEEGFGAFIGEDPNGVWTLTVSDDANLDGGSLDSWTLALATLDETPTATLTVGANAPALVIPAGPGVVSDTLNIAGAMDTICDVNVLTNITHTFSADLEITLTSPAGTSVTLTTDNGGANDNSFSGTLWDDDADPGNPAPFPAATFAASNMVTDTTYVNLVPEVTLTPEEALAAFNGEDPNGDWTLTINDDAGGDMGILAAWSLDIMTCACADVSTVTVVSANPPLDNPYEAGAQPYLDALDTGSTAALTDGIGADGTDPQGTVQYAPIQIVLSGVPSSPVMPGDITVSCTGGSCPGVMTVNNLGPIIEVTLTAAIPPAHCTTLALTGPQFAAGQQVQYRSLPGDTSHSGTTNTQDLLSLVQALNNGDGNVLTNHARFNVNRSTNLPNVVNTQDLLRLVQLLNGTLTTQPFNQVSVAACP